jgi:hypothetical protein
VSHFLFLSEVVIMPSIAAHAEVATLSVIRLSVIMPSVIESGRREQKFLTSTTDHVHRLLRRLLRSRVVPLHVQVSQLVPRLTVENHLAD